MSHLCRPPSGSLSPFLPVLICTTNPSQLSSKLQPTESHKDAGFLLCALPCFAFQLQFCVLTLVFPTKSAKTSNISCNLIFPLSPMWASLPGSSTFLLSCCLEDCCVTVPPSSPVNFPFLECCLLFSCILTCCRIMYSEFPWERIHGKHYLSI